MLARQSDLGMPVVADFEISRDDAHVASFATTTIGRAAGTPPWMAPEVLGRRSKGDMRADMWALGVMLADTLAVDSQSVSNFDRQFLHAFSGATDDQVARVLKFRGVLFR